jgi:hypothetical protein
MSNEPTNDPFGADWGGTGTAPGGVSRRGIGAGFGLAVKAGVEGCAGSGGCTYTCGCGEISTYTIGKHTSPPKSEPNANHKTPLYRSEVEPRTGRAGSGAGRVRAVVDGRGAGGGGTGRGGGLHSSSPKSSSAVGTAVPRSRAEDEAGLSEFCMGGVRSRYSAPQPDGYRNTCSLSGARDSPVLIGRNDCMSQKVSRAEFFPKPRWVIVPGAAGLD